MKYAENGMSCIDVAIIGGGPAGLTAAYLLAKKKMSVTVLEANPSYVGGLSRTVRYKGFGFDIGGHRFFSKSKQIEDLWSELLPNDMLVRPRSSRIYYNGKFFQYPLRAWEALLKLGPIEAARCVASYAKARLHPNPAPQNFQEWVINQFGERLFEIFFKTYTEKVWGMACTEISADWAAQRIKGLSLGGAIMDALLPRWAKPKRPQAKTLIESFRYPRRGPGMLWEACARAIEALGGQVKMGERLTALEWDAAQARFTVRYENERGEKKTLQARSVISSAPLRELAQGLSPKLPAEVIEQARKLRYRDFITVALIVKDRDSFDDQWVYVHDPGVRVGRVQNYRSWSPEMVPEPGVSCYGLEYFCFEGDGMWTSSDEDLLALAKREIQAIGLAKAADVVDGCVVRERKAYPVYDDTYAESVALLRSALETQFPTLHVVGRNGMHKYNNQDHAMMTAMLTVENIVSGSRGWDVWRVNQDAEYHEEDGAASGLRQTPQRIS